MRLSFAPFLVLAVVASCTPTVVTPTQPRIATVTPPHEDRPPLTRRAALVYEVHGRPFPLPLVSGTIAGQPALLLVDTGANSHVVAGWFARKFGLPMKKLGDVGTDHVGKAIAAFRIDRADLAIDGWGPLAPGAVLATELPEAIEKLGIAGFISPQHLLEEGDAAVLDLAKGELRAAWWDESLSALEASGSPVVTSEEAQACAENDGPIAGLSFVVPARIESERVNLLVDTGAQHSDVFLASRPGQKLAPRSVANKEPMYTASGKSPVRRLEGVEVGAASFATKVDVYLIGGAADASCARDGVLAMDVLRSCTLLFGRSKLYGRCL